MSLACECRSIPDLLMGLAIHHLVVSVCPCLSPPATANWPTYGRMEQGDVAIVGCCRNEMATTYAGLVAHAATRGGRPSPPRTVLWYEAIQSCSDLSPRFPVLRRTPHPARWVSGGLRPNLSGGR